MKRRKLGDATSVYVRYIATEEVQRKQVANDPHVCSET